MEKVFNLSNEIVEEIEKAVAEELKKEKETYHNTLVPFAEYAGKTKERVLNEYHEHYDRLNHISDLLEERMTDEEKKNPDIPEVARYEAFRNALEEFEKNPNPGKYKADTLQDAHKISPEFMDRIYSQATLLLMEGNYEEAENLFFFLRYFNPTFYEYWLGEATCLHEQQKYENAIDTYVGALLRNPEEPLPFLQMACCYLAMENKENAIACLNSCLERIDEMEEKSEEIKGFETEALEIKNNIGR